MEPEVQTKFIPQKTTTDILKVVLVGNTKVGKTTLLHALTRTGIAERGYSASLEISLIRSKKTPQSKIVGKIYDLRSQRYFPYLHSQFYNGAKGAIIVFDITNKFSFDSMTKWRNIIWGHTGNIPILICGNKSDLRADKEDHITIEDAEKLAKEIAMNQKTKIPYLEISALKRIVAHSSDMSVLNKTEDIYPTIDAFRQPFVNWLFEIIKKR
ncbi:MAG: GTP-binding protein [Candidatus Heimdallarchaeota archaeon]